MEHEETFIPIKKWKLTLKKPLLGRSRSSSVTSPCPLKSCLKTSFCPSSRSNTTTPRLSSSAPTASTSYMRQREPCPVLTSPPPQTPDLVHSASPPSYLTYRPLASPTLSSSIASPTEILPLSGCCTECRESWNYGLSDVAEESGYIEHWSKGAAEKRMADRDGAALRLEQTKVDEVASGSKVDQILRSVKACQLEEEDEDEEMGQPLSRRASIAASREFKAPSASPVLTVSTKSSYCSAPRWTAVKEAERREQEEKDRHCRASFWVKHNLSGLISGAAGARGF